MPPLYYNRDRDYYAVMAKMPLAFQTIVKVPEVLGCYPAIAPGAGRFRQPLVVSHEVGLYLHPIARGLACSLYGLSAGAGCLGIPMPCGLGFTDTARFRLGRLS